MLHRGVTLHHYIETSQYKNVTVCIGDINVMIHNIDLVLSKTQLTVSTNYNSPKMYILSSCTHPHIVSNP